MSMIINSLIIWGGKKLIDIHKNKKQQERDEEAAEKQADVDKATKKLAALENNRQAVLNQAGAIREMKSEVFNPYANVGVATKAADLKIEQTDEALANTLDTINRSGTGAGAATALARMAAQSKAQVGASLETQEAQNQKLRMQGEAQVIAQKQQIEQAALGAEESAWGRQEGRDVAMLDRLAGLQENAQARQMAHEQGQLQQQMQNKELWMQAGVAAADIGVEAIKASG